jgi:uncharacterized coiled-coil protein SlyX
MNEQQTMVDIVKKVVTLESKLDAQLEQIRNLCKRVDDTTEVTKGIYKLATNVELYAQKVEHLAEKMEGRMSQIENRQVKQGERIGALETKPAKKWDLLMGYIMAAFVTGGIGVLIGWIVASGGG